MKSDQDTLSPDVVACEICGCLVNIHYLGWHRDRHGYPRQSDWHQLDKNEDRDFGGHG